MVTAAPGQVVGVAGRSLAKPGQPALFGDKGKVGAAGEARTARLLDELAARPGGPTVLHDLRIPIPGFKANIDHAVVSGRDVTLIDSKVWKAGFYWTLGGRTFRGIERVEHADRKTLATGRDGIDRFLQAYGLRVRFRPGVLVVWTGGAGQDSNFWFYRPHGAVPIRGAEGGATLARLARLTGTKPADPQLVAALSKLIYT